VCQEYEICCCRIVQLNTVKVNKVHDLGGPCSTNGGEEERVYTIGGKARRKETNRKTKTWWVDNIRMNLGEVGWGDVDWIGLAEDRNRWRALVNSVLNLRVP
jgi:hypothetical protein